VSTKLLQRWKKELRDRPLVAFSGNGKRIAVENGEAELERKIGQMTMENDFLKKTLVSFRGEREAGSWRRAIYEEIREEQGPVARLCVAASVSRSGYLPVSEPGPSKRGGEGVA
jgi:hypothetical protein